MKKIVSGIWPCLAASLILIACGGGGGDSPSPSPAPSIQYTGLSTPAVITAQDAHDLALGAYRIASENTLATAANISYHSASKPFYKNITNMANRAADYQIVPSNVIAGALITESDTTNGVCGGTEVISITYDDVTGDYTGTITENNYCDEDGDVANGTANISGRVDLVTRSFLTMTISTNSINIRNGAESSTFRGSILINYQTGSLGITMDIYVRNDVSLKVAWVRNFTITAVDGDSYVDITMSGRFYNPDYGYVELTTTNPVRQYTSLQNPSSGILVISGAPGSAGGNTRAQLVFLTSSSYEVNADTNGDGLWDWNSGTRNW
jgi:hypothetical protein